MLKVNLKQLETKPINEPITQGATATQKNNFDFLVIPAVILMIISTLFFYFVMNHFKFSFLSFLAIPSLIFNILILITAGLAMLSRNNFRLVMLGIMVFQNLALILLAMAILTLD